MAVDVYGTRIRETTTTTGTGTLTLAGAVQGRKAFNTIGVGSTCSYMLEDGNNTAWERGRGTIASSSTLARTTVYESTNSNAAISLSSGTHRVFITPSPDIYEAMVVTPEQYGAVGDGTTDDTLAIQAALNTGAPVVYCHKTYKTTATLQLQTRQILKGPERALLSDASAPRIVFRPAVNGKPAIKNAAGTSANGCEDMAFDLAHNTNTAIQFASSYGNIAKRCWFIGTFNIGIMAHDTYVCEFSDCIMNGASIKSFGIYISELSNAVVVRRLHMSNLPNDNAVCMYGVAIKGGSVHTLDDCVIQGPTIGIATGAVSGVYINNPYFENTLCNMRLGGPNAGPEGYGIMSNGGTLGTAFSSHPQFASVGPVVMFNAGRAVFTCPNFQSTAANTTADGPWPFMLGTYAGNLVVHNAVHYGYEPVTANGARDLFYRQNGGVNASLTVTGATYGSHSAHEIILKEDSSYGSLHAGIRVSGTTITAVAYTPAVIFAAVDALLMTTLPSGASLVL